MAESESEDKESKTEAPTENKLREARKQGDVPVSREAGTLMSVLSLFAIAVFVLPRIASLLTERLSGVFADAGQINVGTGEAGLTDLGRVLTELAGMVAGPLLPVFGGMLLAGLFGILIQGETVVAAERIRPKLSNISPISGFKRMFSVDGLIEFFKSVSKVLVVGVIAVIVARSAVTTVWQGPGVEPEVLPGYLDHFAGITLLATCVFLLPVTLGDIVWKRFSWLRKQRMTLKELKEERKEQEGDPHLKAHRRGVARKRARQRMAQAVPKATLILTNPTHYAVALRYEQATDAAPICVAKGSDMMARRIRDIAREHNIPIIENKPLARALHARVEVDEMVPVEHWQAVAEIVGYVLDLRRNIRRKPPKGSELRREG